MSDLSIDSSTSSVNWSEEPEPISSDPLQQIIEQQQPPVVEPPPPEAVVDAFESSPPSAWAPAVSDAPAQGIPLSSVAEPPPASNDSFWSAVAAERLGPWLPAGTNITAADGGEGIRVFIEPVVVAAPENLRDGTLVEGQRITLTGTAAGSVFSDKPAAPWEVANEIRWATSGAAIGALGAELADAQPPVDLSKVGFTVTTAAGTGEALVAFSFAPTLPQLNGLAVSTPVASIFCPEPLALATFDPAKNPNAEAVTQTTAERLFLETAGREIAAHISGVTGGSMPNFTPTAATLQFEPGSAATGDGTLILVLPNRRGFALRMDVDDVVENPLLAARAAWKDQAPGGV